MPDALPVPANDPPFPPADDPTPPVDCRRFPPCRRVHPHDSFANRWRAKRADHDQFVEALNQANARLHAGSRLPDALGADWLAVWADDLFIGVIPRHDRLTREQTFTVADDLDALVQALRFSERYSTWLAGACRVWFYELPGIPGWGDFPTVDELAERLPDWNPRRGLEDHPGDTAHSRTYDQVEFLDAAGFLLGAPTDEQLAWLRRLAYRTDPLQPLWTNPPRHLTWARREFRAVIPTLAGCLGVAYPEVGDELPLPELVRRVHNWTVETARPTIGRLRTETHAGGVIGANGPDLNTRREDFRPPPPARPRTGSASYAITILRPPTPGRSPFAAVAEAFRNLWQTLANIPLEACVNPRHPGWDEPFRRANPLVGEFDAAVAAARSTPGVVATIAEPTIREAESLIAELVARLNARRHDRLPALLTPECIRVRNSLQNFATMSATLPATVRTWLTRHFLNDPLPEQLPRAGGGAPEPIVFVRYEALADFLVANGIDLLPNLDDWMSAGWIEDIMVELTPAEDPSSSPPDAIARLNLPLGRTRLVGIRRSALDAPTHPTQPNVSPVPGAPTGAGIQESEEERPTDTDAARPVRDPGKPGRDRQNDILAAIRAAGTPLMREEIIAALRLPTEGKLGHQLAWMGRNGILINIPQRGYWPADEPVPE